MTLLSVWSQSFPVYVPVKSSTACASASSSFFLFAPPASFFGGSLKEAQSSTIPEMPAPGQTSDSNKGYGNAKGKLESIYLCCGDKTQRESASPISFNHLRALQRNICSTAVQSFFFPLLIYRWIWLKEPACGRNMDPEEKGLISKQEIWQGVYLLIGEQKGNTVIYGVWGGLGNGTEQH